MAYNLVASISQGVEDGALGPTADIDTSGANLIVVGVHFSLWTGGLESIVDNKGNTYPFIFAANSGVPSNCAVHMYYCLNPTVGANHHFNIGFDATGSGASLTVLAFSGAPATASVDVSAANSISTYFVNTLQPGPIVPAGDDQLFVTTICIGAHTLGGWASADVASIDSGFTLQEQVLGTGTWLTNPRYMNGAIAYKIQTSGHSENPSWSWTESDTIGASQIVTFKPLETPSEPQPPFGGHIGPLAWVHWPRRIP